MRFTTWLLAQVRRKDDVGCLAQDLRHGRFPGWPKRAWDVESFEDYLVKPGRNRRVPPGNVLDALHTAWAEYEKEWPEEGTKEERKHEGSNCDIQVVQAGCTVEVPRSTGADTPGIEVRGRATGDQ